MKERSLSDVKNIAIGLLARREHSQKELRQKLNARSLDRAFIDEVLVALRDSDLQSDERFCEAYIRSRASRGFGPVKIRIELSERGVDEEIIDNCFDETQIDWFELIEVVRNKKFGSEIPSAFEGRMKQLKFLEYRGFGGDPLNSVFR